MPRRARHLIPRGVPRRVELIAVCAVAILVAHLLLAQLTLVLAVVFALAGKTTRWRLRWLLVPAAAGLAWTMLLGPDKALAGFVAGPSSILWHLDGGQLAGRLGHPFAGFGDAQSWLPRQFPVALICGAAEAALVGWLDWLHTDEWAVQPPRPGLVAATRRAITTSAVRAGTVVTRDGCALGVVPATGATAELRWTELIHGTLVVGAATQQVTLAGLQVVHAALRRRKPVLVLDLGDAAIACALGTACVATGTPLLANGAREAAGHAIQVTGTANAGRPGADRGVARTAVAGTGNAGAAGASRLWGRGTSQEPRSAGVAGPPQPPGSEWGRGGPAERQPAEPMIIDLGQVVRQRSAVLLPADSQELAARACADLASLAAYLRRIGVDGDALVWVPQGERVPAQALGALLRDGPDVGLSVLIGTTSPAAAAELSGLAGTTLMYRVADQGLAASLATRTGTRLLPAPIAAALDGRRSATDPWAPAPAPGVPVPPSAPASPNAPAQPSFPAPPNSYAAAPAVALATVPDLAPCPVIPARALLTLGKEEFVLAVSAPRQRLITLGRMVPARLPERVQ